MIIDCITTEPKCRYFGIKRISLLTPWLQGTQVLLPHKSKSWPLQHRAWQLVCGDDMLLLDLSKCGAVKNVHFGPTWPTDIVAEVLFVQMQLCKPELGCYVVFREKRFSPGKLFSSWTLPFLVRVCLVCHILFWPFDLNFCCINNETVQYVMFSLKFVFTVRPSEDWMIFILTWYV